MSKANEFVLDQVIIVAVMEEVSSSFSEEEIVSKSNAELWAEVDTQNTYEEDWRKWKKAGIRSL